MMLAINGIPVVAIELKNQLTGQTVDNAKLQWQYDRDKREPAFQLNHRILAYFAIDLYEAWMTTELKGADTYFLPFNQGSNGAGNDGGRRCAEHSLEHDIDPQRDIQPQMAVIALNERVEAADECAGAAEHQAEADDPVARGADAEVHHILHQNIAGVLRTGKAGFTQSEARLHEVNEERCYQRPTGVDGVEHNFPYLPTM